MILAIDGYEANVEQRVGIGLYAFELLHGISRLLSADTQVRVYLPQEPLSDLPKERSDWQYRVKQPSKFWTFIGLPLALRESPRADVVFSPTHYVPRFTGIPRVMSIMDLSYLYFPELFKTKDLYQLVHWTKYSVEHAHAIVTISQFTKNAILERYTVASEKVYVTYPGFRMKPHNTVDIQKKYQVTRPYLLSVGTVQPRKNYVRLIEAFSKVKQKPEHKDLELVIVGKKGWLFEETLAAPERFSVADSVRFLDFIPDEDLPDLYTNAACFVLPSLYEGFGLPVLEAMQYEKIVVVSNTSSLPEIAGDAGILVDPYSVDQIAEGIQQALSENGTVKGQERIKRGLAHCKQFSWQESAKKTLDVLERVAQGDL